MTAARVDALAWIAIYLGMILLGLGIALERGGAAFGWTVAVVGGLGIAAGAVLIWLRSRMDRGA